MMQPRAKPSRWYGSWLDPLGIAHRTLACAMNQSREYAQGRLLDIGCGNKPYWQVFADRASSYIGIEMPGTLSASSVVDVYANALELPFASGQFETILCNQVLEHIPEPMQLMNEAVRVLHAEGCLILTTPMTWGLHEEPRDFYRYTKYGLQYLAERAGLRVEKIIPTCGLWATVGQRASSHVYHSHGKRAPSVLKGAIVMICAIIQLLAEGLDRWYGFTGDTLDYLLIARKV